MDKDEAHAYKAKLDEYRWTLRLSSKSADFLERAISMLATSTGVLVKGIPLIPDPERILSRRRVQTRPSISTQTNSAYEHSESEFHDDTSPEHMAGETPLSSGASAGWNADHLWFTNGEDQDEDIAANPYLQISEMPNGFNFQGV